MGKVASDLRSGDRMKEVEVIPRGTKIFFWLRRGGDEKREKDQTRAAERRKGLS